MRKTIDYFCHTYAEPAFLENIKLNDQEFASSDQLSKIKWVATTNDNIYNPQYHDILRVALTHQFNRGRFSDLVSLLSGRNFETKTYEEAIAEQTFKQLVAIPPKTNK
jgi:hypothetical protein